MNFDPVAISLASLVMSKIALGWNIRAKFIAPKAHVTVSVSGVSSPRESLFSPYHMDKYLGSYLQVTNHGPGDVVIDQVIAHGFSMLPSKKRHYYQINTLPDGVETIFERSRELPLPAKLQMGETVRFYFSAWSV